MLPVVGHLPLPPQRSHLEPGVPRLLALTSDADPLSPFGALEAAQLGLVAGTGQPVAR
jgi:hypothetical protein